jgi:hypothetical protein
MKTSAGRHTVLHPINRARSPDVFSSLTLCYRYNNAVSIDNFYRFGSPTMGSSTEHAQKVTRGQPASSLPEFHASHQRDAKQHCHPVGHFTLSCNPRSTDTTARTGPMVSSMHSQPLHLKLTHTLKFLGSLFGYGLYGILVAQICESSIC